MEGISWVGENGRGRQLNPVGRVIPAPSGIILSRDLPHPVYLAKCFPSTPLYPAVCSLKFSKNLQRGQAPTAISPKVEIISIY